MEELFQEMEPVEEETEKKQFKAGTKNTTDSKKNFKEKERCFMRWKERIMNILKKKPKVNLNLNITGY